jgi:hypothetical protein
MDHLAAESLSGEDKPWLASSWVSQDRRYKLDHFIYGTYESRRHIWETNFAPENIGGRTYFKPAESLLNRNIKAQGSWEVQRVFGGPCSFDIDMVIKWPSATDKATSLVADFTYPAYVSGDGCRAQGGFLTTSIKFFLVK